MWGVVSMTEKGMCQGVRHFEKSAHLLDQARQISPECLLIALCFEDTGNDKFLSNERPPAPQKGRGVFPTLIYLFISYSMKGKVSL